MDFSFADKNRVCILIISADGYDDALKLLKQKVKYSGVWGIELIRDDVDEIG